MSEDIRGCSLARALISRDAADTRIPAVWRLSAAHHNLSAASALLANLLHAVSADTSLVTRHSTQPWAGASSDSLPIDANTVTTPICQINIEYACMVGKQGFIYNQLGTLMVYDARHWEGAGWGSGPPLMFRPLLRLAQIRWSLFIYFRGILCMYIVTFTAHQQRKIVLTLNYFGLATTLLWWQTSFPWPE